MTQDSVARAVGLDRSAIVHLEKGERNLRVPELVRIAEVLGRPLSFFVDPPVAAVVSRRQATHTAHQSTGLLDADLAQFAGDVRTLAESGLIVPAGRPADAHVPRTVDQAEPAAERFRKSLWQGREPLPDLARACERLGLFVFVAELTEGGPDGGCVEFDTRAGVAGAAVINGDAEPGRRRMTLAHELGHWLFGDAFDVDATLDTEKKINAFAIHFLAPRAGVRDVWAQHSAWSVRDRAPLCQP
nr:helix-turn-helix domain-containing protein [Propionibacterium sp.]